MPTFDKPMMCMKEVEKNGQMQKCGKVPTAVDPTTKLCMCHIHWGQDQGTPPADVSFYAQPAAPVKTRDKTVFNGEGFPYEEELRLFSDAMRYKMMKNRHKGKWEDLDLSDAFALLRREVDELEKAITEGNSIDITLEGADVAVFALIATHIALVRGGRRVVRS